MKICLLLALTVVLAASLPVAAFNPTRSKKTMRAFRSEQELKRYLRAWAKKHPRKPGRGMNFGGGAPEGLSAETMKEVVMVSAAPESSLKDESVTNVQHAGVDEGGIVKVHGDHLVVLRRGRLFTVAIGDGALQPISNINAFGPEIDPKDTWYDEMLISENTIAVIGYSYERGGTEVGLFDIDNAGRLSYRSTYHLRSDDYYSSRNFASRLIGSKLIFYSPDYLFPGEPHLMESFPAVRRWHKGAKPEEFQPILPATRVYVPATGLQTDDGSVDIHTVTICDLAGGGFNCEATSVIGPPGHVFYVSPDSVYIWASTWSAKEKNKSILFRMPLDGSGPSALRVSGSPVDQFSFLQSDDQHLNVLVRSESKGDGMWAAEVAKGDVALMRVPLYSFSDGSDVVHRANYRKLQRPMGETFQNRFVGNYVLYGTGSGWEEPQKHVESELFIVDWRFGNPHRLLLPHGVDRIEQMGSDAVVVGTDGKDLHFSSVRLGPSPEIVSRYTRHEASQGELRSHGFFYKPDGENTGMLGLPISTPARPGFEHLFQNSAAILFLRNESLQFQEVGELGSQPDKTIDDKCQASCVDWYGNARPLFLRGRVFALLGYEIVEGTLNGGRMTELRRINYAP